MGQWRNDAKLFELMRGRLYTPVAGDILDAMGYSRQLLPTYIMPLRDEVKLTGQVCTVLEQNVFEPQRKPFGLLTEALDQLKRNEVCLATGAANSALWGELLAATAKVRGVAETVLDGYTWDTPQVLQQNFPIFVKGHWVQDSFIQTNVVDFRCRIEIGQMVIDDGDIVFEDMDGVLIVPRKAGAEYIERALEKTAGEKVVRKAIKEGMSATEAFRKSEILRKAKQRNTRPFPGSRTGNGRALA